MSAVTSKVKGALSFGTFDLFKGFWQMPLHDDSQELFSFVTEDGVYTPTRVPQGAVDSALHFQSQMQEVYSRLLYNSMLIWIDGIAFFGQDDASYLETLKQFFQIFRENNLKLSATKSSLIERPINW